jgi:hypothetical protein
MPGHFTETGDGAQALSRTGMRQRSQIDHCSIFGLAKDLPGQALHVAICYDLHSTGEYLIIHKLTAAPMDLLLVASLCENG